MLVRMQVTATILYDCNRNDKDLAETVSLKRLTDDLARFGTIEAIKVDMVCNRMVRVLFNGKYADVVCKVDSDGKSIIPVDTLAGLGIGDNTAFTRRDSTDSKFIELTAV